jgi:hypothetical protein
METDPTILYKDYKVDFEYYTITHLETGMKLDMFANGWTADDMNKYLLYEHYRFIFDSEINRIMYEFDAEDIDVNIKKFITAQIIKSKEITYFKQVFIMALDDIIKTEHNHYYEMLLKLLMWA